MHHTSLYISDVTARLRRATPSCDVLRRMLTQAEEFSVSPLKHGVGPQEFNSGTIHLHLIMTF